MPVLGPCQPPKAIRACGSLAALLAIARHLRVPEVVTWAEFEDAAAGLAAAARERLTASRVALLGTIRADGSPRVSPIEPYFTVTQLLFGAMVWSRKVTDLSRDPRLVLHSTLTGPDNGESEIKVYGVAVEADSAMRASCPDGWWHSQASNRALVFTVLVTEACFIKWDLPAAELTVTTWTTAAGLNERRRSYP